MTISGRPILQKLLSQTLKSLTVSAWFIFLTFPFLVVHINPLNRTVTFRWGNIPIVGISTFFLSFVWRYFMYRKTVTGSFELPASLKAVTGRWLSIATQKKTVMKAQITLLSFAILFPVLFSYPQISLMTTTLNYVMLGLGLNIVVGLAGLLDLGYVAFYAVGAYCYALLNHHYGVGFWTALPIGATMAALFGILLGIPVLRLRGDYLAIVTMGFGEIIRIVLENWDSVFFGPSGISRISRPSLFGIDTVQKSVPYATTYMYYIVLGLVIVTIFFVTRLKNSRIGRAWIALREDEIACQAMGINKMKTKLTAFALGATWAGLAGAVFAAKTTFINPSSFTFWESVMILSIVVLGGMGSIPGVILGSFFIILLQEYFRPLKDYRMLIFGMALVLTMVFKPQGLFGIRRTVYHKAPQEPEPEKP